MKKNLFFVVMLCMPLLASSAPTDLAPGDIAIISFNFKDPDEFSFVPLVELSPGTVILFTDCGWKEDGSFREGEGVITYTVPESGKREKEVITFPHDPGFVTQGKSGFFGFAEAGDQILVFQGSFEAPIFIFALNNNDFGWVSSATDNNTSALPPGLIDGISAISLGRRSSYAYNCVEESGAKETIYSAVMAPANWLGSNTERAPYPSSCFREVLPVTLLSFKIEKTISGIIIKFQAFNESDIYKYQIEGSQDGIEFYHLCDIDASGSAEMNQYVAGLKAGPELYFRLNAVGMKGETERLKLGCIKDDPLPISIHYPIHTPGEILVRFLLPQGENQGEIQICDSGGKLVKQFSVDRYQSEVLIPSGPFLPGLYFCSLKSGSYFSGYKKIFIMNR